MKINFRESSLQINVTVEHQFYKLTKGREKVYKSGKFTKMGNS